MPSTVYGLALYGPVCRVGVASGIRETSTSHHGAPSLWARLMSSPGVVRTAAVDFWAGARLVEQLATSTANAANAISFRGLLIGNARIT
ncbi:hypothetical protein D3C85_1657220 [compost metagenome]